MTVYVVDADRDRRAYQLAREYLKSLTVVNGPITDGILDSYVPLANRPNEMSGIYCRMLESIRNTSWRSGVIGDPEALSPILCDFNPAAILVEFPDAGAVLDSIKAAFPDKSFRSAKRSIWPAYCRSILSAALFLSQFGSVDEFYSWVSFFDDDERARLALPLLMDAEIEGFGFALACDFLKELGFTNYCKPDVHLKGIFTALGLSPQSSSDLDVNRAICRVAKHVGRTPYAVDKLFWQIGSGYFYDHKHIGDGGKIGRHKQWFIEYAKGQMEDAASEDLGI